MKIEEIEKLWEEDSKIKEYKLADEALNIPKLHAKYYRLYIREKLAYTELKEKEKTLEELLFNYFAKTLTDDEIKEYGFVYTDRKYMKADIPKAVASHKDMITYRLKLAAAYEKAEFLKSVLAMIGQRSFQIKDAINWKMFEAGN